MKMSSNNKPVVARFEKSGKRFEILVDPDKAFNYKQTKKGDIYEILVVDEIFSDANKGTRASEEDIKKIFSTDDVYEVAKKILDKGDLQITTKQRQELIEKNKKKISYIISRCAVDPRTKLPHPQQRILEAMEKARVKIDPFKSAEEQVENVIKELQKKAVLFLSIETKVIKIHVPGDISAKCYGRIKKISGVKNELWLSDGSFECEIEVPAGAMDEIINLLNDIGKGKIEFKIIK